MAGNEVRWRREEQTFKTKTQKATPAGFEPAVCQVDQKPKPRVLTTALSCLVAGNEVRWRREEQIVKTRLQQGLNLLVARWAKKLKQKETPAGLEPALDPEGQNSKS